MDPVAQILDRGLLDKPGLEYLLQLNDKSQQQLFSRAACVKESVLGNIVYFRGLIEFSNQCAKDCLYCGIRKSNLNNRRYLLSDDEIVNTAVFAHQHEYASIVLQAGELISDNFTRRIDMLLKKIHRKTKGELRITLSLGEQTFDTYKRWFESGAQRYLLRIETSNKELYGMIHPKDDHHVFVNRFRSLESLKKIGYQTGTGVMIGLPFQTIGDLADDLLFMKQFEIDMVGMGPYLEHAETPLYQFRSQLWPLRERFNLSLRMIACLRILMPKINIAAATALQAIDKMGREKAIKAGANVIMPNITPGKYRDQYKLYDTKPCTDENADDCVECLNIRVGLTGNKIGFGDWGDSVFFHEKAQII
jgi:biotin synthase